MDSALTEQLSSVFASGSGLQSASLTTIAVSVATLNGLSSRLVALADEMIPAVVDPLIILTPLETELDALGGRIQTTYVPVLAGYVADLGLLTDHIEEHLGNFFDELSVASAMTSISAYADVNATMNGISGSAFGMIDAQLANADTAMAALEQALDSFSLDLVEELTEVAEFEVTLTQASSALTTASNSVQASISSEVAALSQMYSRYQQHAKAVSAQLLVSDASSAAIVAQLANPELGALLT